MTAIHEYPTPLTDAAEKESIAAYENEREAGWPPFPCDGYDHARDLERRLALCRDALAGIVAIGQAMPEPSEETEIAIAALAATK